MSWDTASVLLDRDGTGWSRSPAATGPSRERFPGPRAAGIVAVAPTRPRAGGGGRFLRFREGGARPFSLAAPSAPPYPCAVLRRRTFPRQVQQHPMTHSAAPSITVYLADLRHNYGGVLSTDCMPLGVGNMKAVIDAAFPGGEVATRVFAYPDRLLEAMEHHPPDVLMVSNYVWNEALSRAFLARSKRLRPGSLAVMGGPNIPFEPERQTAFVAERPEIDVYVLGEGDFIAREIVKAWFESQGDAKAFAARDLPGCVCRRPDGSLIRHEICDRLGELEEIPSPYLTGVMDEFFDGRLAPIIETNRGCPFRCTFCVQGTDYYTKVHYFGMPRLRAEID